MEARPGSFRYLPDGRSASAKLNEQRVSSVPYEQRTFMKAVAVNLPALGRWRMEEYSHSLLVISRSAIDPGVASLCIFLSTLCTIVGVVIFVEANRAHHSLTLFGAITLLALAFAAVIPFLFMIMLRRDHRLCVEMVSEENSSTRLFVEPCDDVRLNLFFDSLVERLCEFWTQQRILSESERSSES